MKILVTGNLGKEIKPNTRGGSESFTYQLINDLLSFSEIKEIFLLGVGKNYFSNKKLKFIPLIDCETNTLINKTNILKIASINKEIAFFSEYKRGLAIKMFIKIKELIVKRHINIIHNNSTSTVLNSLLGQLSTPVVTTVHTNFDSPSFIIPYHLFNQFKNFYYILIGKHQLQFIRENHIRLSKYHIIPNGLDISNIEPSYDSFDSNYMFWIGRVSSKHNKGLAEAVIAAKKTKKYLKAAITIEDQKFYDTKVKPNLSKYSKIMTTGLSPTLKFDAYRKAKFFIYPIMWEEPFGLVFLESMVTGTPVIAFARGATTEIIKDGLNGYLVNPKNKNNGEFITKKSGVDGVIEAIERIESLNKDEYQNMRIMARKTVEEKYSIRRMTTQYLKIYKKLSK